MIEHIIYLLKNFFSKFLEGLGNTLLLAIIGTVLGLAIGIIIAVIRNIEINDTDSLIKKIFKKIGHVITYIYITVLRGTPMMVQALIVYFGGKKLGMWANIYSSSDPTNVVLSGSLICGLVVITLNTAAYMAENVRAGINSLDKGQMEASRSLGMTYFQAMTRIIIPQALKNAIPNIGNEFIVNIKDSSVLNVISVTELFLSVEIATSNNYFIVEGYIIVACIYLVLTLLATLLVKHLENLASDERKVKKLQKKAVGA